MQPGVAERLATRGLILPAAMPAVANYVPYTLVPAVGGNWIAWIAGQGPFRDGKLEFIGRVGDEIDLAAAAECARLVALNVLAQAAAAGRQAVGGPTGLERTRCLRLGVFVHCTDGYEQMEAVADAASSVIHLALGETSLPARTAVGMPSLPMRTAVEIDAVFEYSRDG